MKTLTALMVFWFLMCLTGFFVGRTILRTQHNDQEEVRFRRDAEAIAATINNGRWLLPLETSQQLTDLENSFDVNIAPSLRSAAAANAGNAWLIRRLGNRLVTSGVVSVAPAAASSATGLDAPPQETTVQLTRKVTAPHTRLWDVATVVTSLAGLLMLWLIRLCWRWEQSQRNELIEPWTAAIERRQSGQRLELPRIENPSMLATHLNIASENVNQILAFLHSSWSRSELVFGNLQEGVLAVDEHSQVLLANRALDEHLKLGGDKYLYRPLLEVVRVPQVTELVQNVLARGAPREDVVDIHLTSRTLRITARPLPVGGGKMGALVTTRDETLLKRIEAVRKDFIANASHELKTPLAAIRAYAETLQMGALDDKEVAPGFVSNIVSQADRIDGLIQGMLQLSRVESGSGLRIEQLDACEAIGPCLAAAQALAHSKGVNLVWPDPPQSLELHSDRDGFQTIGSNLLSNAVRYTPQGGTVSLKLDVEGEMCVLQVTDNGIGIRQEDLQRIFERFYRAEKDRSSDTGGTGLGLSIVKHLTNALGGSVQATSEPGRGSCFKVCLPLNSTDGIFLGD